MSGKSAAWLAGSNLIGVVAGCGISCPPDVPPEPYDSALIGTSFHTSPLHVPM